VTTPATLLDPTRYPLSVRDRILLLVRIWWIAAGIPLAIRRRPLPDVVRRLGARRGHRTWPPLLLSRAVSRGLRIGPWQPRCIIRALVLYRLLRAQGTPAELVIGLSERATSTDAHAWIEVAGRDVGPAPGRFGHQELVRYPQETVRRADGAL
jgi:hypothetical protein